ncbi:MAG: hypothetical protein E7661_05390 [Ruminococcaceae bacterium]|nr:hypothetical protein [Oscillospiraceae bacterium]
MNTTLQKFLCAALSLLFCLSLLTACQGVRRENTDDDVEKEKLPSVIIQSKHHDISADEFAVYQYQVGLSQLTNEYWYYQYGLLEDTYGYSKTFSDAYEYAYYMLPAYVGTNKFSLSAYTLAEQYIVYCEGALETGMTSTLKTEVEAEVDAYIADLKATAEARDMSLKKFIKTYIGSNVSEDELRSAMEKRTLGSKYESLKREELAIDTTHSELVEYRDQHKSAFYKTYYNSYVLANERLREKAERCSTPDELKVMLAEYMVHEKFYENYKPKITDAQIADPNGSEITKVMVLETLLATLDIKPSVAERILDDPILGNHQDENGTQEDEQQSYRTHFSSSDTDAYQKAGYQIFTTILSALRSEINKISLDVSDFYVDLNDEDAFDAATDLQKWLFDPGRKVGDFTVREEVQYHTSSGGSYMITNKYRWCAVTKVMVIDDEKTKDAYFVKLDSEQKANNFYAELSTNMSAKKFDELSVEFGCIAEGGSALKENITEKSASSIGSAFSKWLYDENHRPGDATMLKDNGVYYIIYYERENEETWMMNARSALAAERLEDWVEEVKTKYNVEDKVNSSKWEDETTSSLGSGIVLIPSEGNTSKYQIIIPAP